MSKTDKKKVLIYGAGRRGREVWYSLIDLYEVLGFVDKNPNLNLDIPGGVVYALSDISSFIDTIDHVVISIADQKISFDVKEDLIKKWCVPADKVLFYNDIKRVLLKESYKLLLDEAFFTENVSKKEESIEEKGEYTLNESAAEEISIPEVMTKSKKLRVRLHNMERRHVWNSLRSLALAFDRDERVDLQIITHQEQENCDYVKREISNTIWHEDYDFKTDIADIRIVNPCPYIFDEFYTNTKLLCSIPFYNLHSGDINSFLSPVYENFQSGNLDCTIFEKIVFNDIEQAGISDTRLVCMGNPKFDDIYDKCVSHPPKRLPVDWAKLLKKEKIILYTTTHGVYSDISTLHQYGRLMFEMAKKYPKLGFIFRPHPYLIKELVGRPLWEATIDELSAIWTEEELQRFITILKNSESIVYDDSADYSLGYYLSDAILTETGCGIMLSALPLDKPLAVLESKSGKTAIFGGEGLNAGLYHLKTDAEFINFVEMVLKGDDYKLEDRRAAVKRCIKHFDGLNGERIKNFLINRYQEQYV